MTALFGLAKRGFHLFEVDHPDAPICRGVRTPQHDPATCNDRGKHPVPAHWSESATTDPQALAAITSGATVNLGIACAPSGLVVVDQDTPNGLRVYAASIGESLPETFEVMTHDGRSHLYFRAPAGAKIGNPGILKRSAGCDIRGTGGYVVAPGSRHASGQEYVPVDPDAPVAAMPAWLLALLTAPPVVESTNGTPTWGLDDTEVIPGRRPDRPGERHDRIMRYSSALRSRAMPERDAQVLVEAMWARCEQPPECDTPMTLAEAEGIRADVYRRYESGPSTSARHANGSRLAQDLADRYRAAGTPKSLFAVAAEADDLAAQGIVALEPGDDAPTDQPEATAADPAVERKADELRVLDEARALNARRTAEHVAPPVVTGLRDFLAVPDEPVRYRVDKLLPVGANVIVTAQFKTGKSSLIGNLVRAVADEVDFLDAFPVEPMTGSVVLVDDELDPRTLRRWLRDQGVVNVDRVHVVSLRGRVAEFNLIDPTNRARWAAALREANAGLLIFDCLRPVLDAIGLSEDKDAGRFLVAFDALLAEAEIGEAVIAHHMGHNGERARGDSRLRDWPDVEWRLVRQTEAGEEPDPAAPRFLSAFGRDVEVPEGALTFDKVTRHLTFAGGNRKDAKAGAALPAVLDLLDSADAPLSGRQIDAALKDSDHSRDSVRDAVKAGIESLDILVESGDNRAKMHSRNPSRARVRGSAPPRTGAPGGRCAGAPIGGAPRTTQPDRSETLFDTRAPRTQSEEHSEHPVGDGARPSKCRVCSAALLAPASLDAGICARRDDEHQSARGAS